MHAPTGPGKYPHRLRVPLCGGLARTACCPRGMQPRHARSVQQYANRDSWVHHGRHRQTTYPNTNRKHASSTQPNDWNYSNLTTENITGSDAETHAPYTTGNIESTLSQAAGTTSLTQSLSKPLPVNLPPAPTPSTTSQHLVFHPRPKWWTLNFILVCAKLSLESSQTNVYRRRAAKGQLQGDQERTAGPTNNDDCPGTDLPVLSYR